MLVQPAAARLTIEDLGDRTRIVLPSRKHWFVLAFLSVWLMGWACGEVSALSAVLSGRGFGDGTAFLLVWLVGWTVGGTIAISTWVWQLAGRETFDVTGDSLTVWKSVFGLRFPARVYAAEHVHDLRTPVQEVSPFPVWGRRTWVWGTGPGAIAFDYGARTFQIASGADEAEARLIVAAITQRYPIYRRSR